MKPLKLTLVTLCCASLLAAAPYAVKKVFAPGEGANSTVLTELPSPAAAPAVAEAAPTDPASAEHRAPSARAALPSPLIATPVPKTKMAPASVADAAPPARAPLAFNGDVERAQRMLNTVAGTKLTVDGKLGPMTKSAVSAFQKSAGLDATGDIDAATVAALETRVADAEKAAREKTIVLAEAAPAAPAVPAVAELAPIAAPAAPPAVVAAAPAARVEVVEPKPAYAGATVTAPGSLLNKGSHSAENTLAVPEGMIAQAAMTGGRTAPRVAVADELPAKPQIVLASAAKITAAASAPIASDASPVAESPASRSVVVKVNADAGVPDQPALPAPAAIGSGETADSGVIRVPQEKVTSVPGSAPAAPAASVPRNDALERELAEAQARIAMVTNDSRYEVRKYAPQNMEAVNSLADKVQRDLGTATAGEVQQNLVTLESGLEEAKRLALRKKAQAHVESVDASYKLLTGRFAAQAGREPLKDTMEKVEMGYKAMKADLDKGNYDPILERCEGFKVSIDRLANDAARLYVADRLADKAVLAKLNKDTLKQIDGLKSSGKHVEAADLVIAKAGSASATASSSKSTPAKPSTSSASKTTTAKKTETASASKSSTAKSDTKKSAVKVEVKADTGKDSKTKTTASASTKRR